MFFQGFPAICCDEHNCFQVGKEFDIRRKQSMNSFDTQILLQILQLMVKYVPQCKNIPLYLSFDENNEIFVPEMAVNQIKIKT